MPQPQYLPYILKEGEYRREIISSLSTSEPPPEDWWTNLTSWIRRIRESHECDYFPCPCGCLGQSNVAIMIECNFDKLTPLDESLGRYDCDDANISGDVMVAIPVCRTCELETRNSDTVEIEETPCIIDEEAY